jgi:glycyl-tRNA synthetase
VVSRFGDFRGNLKLYEQTKDELAHYAERTVDILYRFFPERDDEEKQFDELMGIANRTDFDLKTHSKSPKTGKETTKPDSTEDLSYFDEATKQRFYPYVIEPAVGVNRTLLAVLMDAYTEKTNEKGETRVILKLKPELAPIKGRRSAAGEKQTGNRRDGEGFETTIIALDAHRLRRHGRHRQIVCAAGRNRHAVLRDG